MLFSYTTYYAALTFHIYDLIFVPPPGLKYELFRKEA